MGFTTLGFVATFFATGFLAAFFPFVFVVAGFAAAGFFAAAVFLGAAAAGSCCGALVRNERRANSKEELVISTLESVCGAQRRWRRSESMIEQRAEGECERARDDGDEPMKLRVTNITCLGGGYALYVCKRGSGCNFDTYFSESAATFMVEIISFASDTISNDMKVLSRLHHASSRIK